MLFFVKYLYILVFRDLLKSSVTAPFISGLYEILLPDVSGNAGQCINKFRTFV